RSGAGRVFEDTRFGLNRELSNLDLKVGGEGMLGFYDKILPETANKLVKKYGAKVGKGNVKTTDMPVSEYEKYEEGHPYREKNYPTVQTLPLTPALKKGALVSGFPKFAAGGRVLASAINRNPTEAQKEAGNYAKDHVNLHGLDIT